MCIRDRASICPRGGGASSGPSTSQSHAVNSCLPRRGVRPRRCHAAPSGGCAQREAVHAPEDPIKDHYQFNTLRRRDSGGPGRAESSSVLVLRHSPQRISVSSPREDTRIIASCFRSSNHQRSTSRPPTPARTPGPATRIPFRENPYHLQLYSVQCTTLDGPARRSDATRSPIPGEPLTLGSSRMPHVATRESMFTLTTSSLCHPSLPLIQLIVRSRPNQVSPFARSGMSQVMVRMVHIAVSYTHLTLPTKRIV